MRSRLSIVAACLFAVACGPAFAQGSSEKPAKPAPPDKIGGKGLGRWIKEIEHPDPGVRETAIRAVPYFGEPAKAAVPSLLEVLKNDPDVACRVYAALTLSGLAQHLKTTEAAAPAVKVLIDTAEFNQQTIVRLHAVLALGSFGPKANAAIPVLAKRVYDRSSWELRQAALYSLASVAADKKFGPDPKAVVPVAKLLAPADKANSERSSRVRLAAVLALREMGRPTDKEFDLARDALEKATRDPDRSVAIWALVGLMEFEEKFPEQRLSELTNHLKGKDVLAKVTAAAALGALPREHGKTRLPDIIALLEDKDPVVQAAAIDVLTGFGAAAKDAVPALRTIMELKGQSDYFRQASQYAIKQITGKEPELPAVSEPGSGSAAKPAAVKEIAGKTLEDWIKDIIKNPDPSVQETAMQAVPYFGKPARAARKALVERLRDQEHPDVACKAHAILALAAIAEHLNGDDATEAVSAIAHVAEYDGQTILRYHAVVALGAFEGKAASAIPVLVNRLHDPNSWELRQAVVASLNSIAGGDTKTPPDGRAVVALADRLLADLEKSAQVRMVSVMALGSMGKPVINMHFLRSKQALLKATNDPDRSVEIWALVALMAVDKITDQALGKVAEHLKGKDVMEKVTALRALGAMGKEARPKVPDIAELLDDKDPIVIATVLDVLAGLGSPASGAVRSLEKFIERLEKDKEPKNKEQNEYFLKAAKYAIEQINGKPKK